MLVLYLVGIVNPERIARFKRTSQYTRGDHELLVRLLETFSRWFTLAHIMAEVSNLLDLAGHEKLVARHALAAVLRLLDEPHISSAVASGEGLYEELGLTDAAILAATRQHGCAVVTADLALYVALASEDLPVIYFPHYQAAARSL